MNACATNHSILISHAMAFAIAARAQQSIEHWPTEELKNKVFFPFETEKKTTITITMLKNPSHWQCHRVMKRPKDTYTIHACMDRYILYYSFSSQ